MGPTPRYGTQNCPQTLFSGMPGIELERPILLVSGFQSNKENFRDLIEKLNESPANGSQPIFLHGGEATVEGPPRHTHPNAGTPKIFVADFGNHNTPPDVAATLLSSSIDRVKQLTKTDKVDVGSFSMGGLATRVYLDRGGENVGKLMFVGTPHHGSVLAWAGLNLLDSKQSGYELDWIFDHKPLSDSDRPALSWLAPSSPQRIALNSRWPQQRARVEAAINLASNQALTMDDHVMPDAGDGVVTVKSSTLADTETVLITDPSHPKHGTLFNNPQVLNQMKSFFQWKETPIVRGG